MTDARLPGRWLMNMKIAALSDRAWRVFTSALMWSTEQGTDGEIPPLALRFLYPADIPPSVIDELVNADLADVLGNFVNRICKFTESRFEGVVPEGGEPGPLETKLEDDVLAKLRELTGHMEDREFRKSAAALRQLWVLGNQYLTEAAPWTAIKTDRDRAAVAVRYGLNLVALCQELGAQRRVRGIGHGRSLPGPYRA